MHGGNNFVFLAPIYPKLLKTKNNNHDDVPESRSNAVRGNTAISTRRLADVGVVSYPKTRHFIGFCVQISLKTRTREPVKLRFVGLLKCLSFKGKPRVTRSKGKCNCDIDGGFKSVLEVIHGRRAIILYIHPIHPLCCFHQTISNTYTRNKQKTVTHQRLYTVIPPQLTRQLQVYLQSCAKGSADDAESII